MYYPSNPSDLPFPLPSSLHSSPRGERSCMCSLTLPFKYGGCILSTRNRYRVVSYCIIIEPIFLRCTFKRCQTMLLYTAIRCNTMLYDTFSVSFTLLETKVLYVRTIFRCVLACRGVRSHSDKHLPLKVLSDPSYLVRK